jgi:hypothetical protein
MKAKDQIEQAIKWIDELPDYKQASWKWRKTKMGSLGDAENGYCCLGAGCVITKTPFTAREATSTKFKNKVGLIKAAGIFEGDRFYGEYALAGVNDNTQAGFKRISKLLKTRPRDIFIPVVAVGVENHYKNQEV